jgi:hypothetical protein
LTPTLNEKKIIITQLLYSIKKVSSIYFFFTIWKKNYKREKKKISRGKNIKLKIS